MSLTTRYCIVCGAWKEYKLRRSPTCGSDQCMAKRRAQLLAEGITQGGPRNRPMLERKNNPGGGFLVYMPDSEMARRDGYVLEHMLVMVQKLGRRLMVGERVYHLNGCKADNRPENLETNLTRRGLTPDCLCEVESDIGGKCEVHDKPRPLSESAMAAMESWKAARKATEQVLAEVTPSPSECLCMVLCDELAADGFGMPCPVHREKRRNPSEALLIRLTEERKSRAERDHWRKED